MTVQKPLPQSKNHEVPQREVTIRRNNATKTEIRSEPKLRTDGKDAQSEGRATVRWSIVGFRI
jgi:hypothetical protein